MNYPNTYKDIFKNVVLNSLSLLGAMYELKSFYYGESRRIEEAMKSDIKYPVLWAELPEFSYKDMGDNMLKETIGAFIILSGQPVEEYDGQDNSIDKAVQLAEQVIKYLKGLGFIVAGDTINIEPITTQMSDNCYGCRTSFRIKNQEADFLC